MAKILFVSSIFRNLYQFRRGLMTTLLKKNHRVYALAYFDGSESYLQKIGVKCIPLKMIERGGLNPFKEIRLMRELYSKFKDKKYDLILLYTVKPNIYGPIASYFLKTPSMCTVSGRGHSFSSSGLLNITSRIMYKIAFLFPKVIFFQNEDDQVLFERMGIIDRKKSLLVPGSGVNIHHYTKEKYNEMKVEDGNIIFLFIGRLLWEKGIREFVEVTTVIKKKYPDTKFHVLGSADSGNPSVVPQKILRSWEKEYEIKYLGYLKDVRPEIYKSDVVVLPSYMEGTPRSLLEALAMEKPIITTNAPGCRNVIEDGKNGFMVPVKNVSSLANAMTKMIALGKDRMKKMGKYGRQKVEREFDEKIVIKKYMEQILNII